MVPRGIRPCLDSKPYDGFKVGKPLQDPGILKDPPVSDPNAAKQVPEETAIAEPPELPPAMQKSPGFKASVRI